MSTKIFFPPKIHQDRVANNIFYLQNDFHEDRLNFPAKKGNARDFLIILENTIFKIHVSKISSVLNRLTFQLKLRKLRFLENRF